jgi:hypothetical protein
MSTILREENVEYSVLQWIREGLPDYGFVIAPAGGANVVLREAFPTPEERSEPLTMTTIAFGFNMDDGGREVELGSNLTQYRHTLEVWVFAMEPRFGRRVADAIKHIVRKQDDNIPLLDFNQEDNPVIDALRVLKAQAAHQANSSPRPWDQFVYTCSIAVEDTFYPE